MNGYTGAERRRSVRSEGLTGGECRVALRSRVRLFDISADGVWLGCDTPLPPGTRLTVTTLLAGMPFTAEVVIRRVGSSHGRSGQMMGATFASMDESNRRTLSAFLHRATE